MACCITDEAEPWQQGSFTETNLHMLENNILCDVTFLVGKNEEPVWAHKFMLASRSPVFYAMFCGPLAESHGAIRLPDVEASIIRIVIGSIYTDDCDVSGENVMSLLYVAQKYALDGLVKKCSQFLTEHMDTDNVCTILQQAMLYNRQDLVNDSLAYIVDNGEDVFKADSFYHLDAQAIKKIIELDGLAVKEEHVYKACVGWANHQCITNEKDVSDQNIRECLGEILYLIRFPTMPIETFTDVVSKIGVLTLEEKMEIFQSFGGTVKRFPKFSTCRRNYQRKVVIVKRFATISKGWNYGGEPDAISFSCSNDAELVGVSLFTPVEEGSTKGSFEILEGDQTIYEQQVKLSYDESVQYNNITFEKVVKIKSGKEYTLKQTLLGQKTFFGYGGKIEIADSNCSVQFFISLNSGNNTSVKHGQFYRLILHC